MMTRIETYPPGIPEINLVNPNKDHSSPAGRRMRKPFLGGQPARPIQRGDDDVRDTHTDGAGDQDWLPPKLIDVQNCWYSGEEHENAADAAREERGGVSGQAEVLEDELYSAR